MVATPKFCSKCGSPLSAGTRFCAQCGTPVQPMPAAPAPAVPSTVVQVNVAAPAQPFERIVGIITVQQRKGFMGAATETYNMIVTPSRLALVFVSNKEMQQAVVVARDQARAEGKGFFGQMGAQMGWLNVLYRRYEQAPIDASLAGAPGSFVIASQEVRSIRLHDPVHVTNVRQANTTRSEMTVETAAAKFKFELVTMSAREARQVLQQTLGGVVH